jgi:hypothetical protein
MTSALTLPSTWEEVAPLLRPQLRSDAWLDRRELAAERRGQRADGSHRRLSSRPDADLHVTLVVDAEETMTAVSERMIERWGVSFDRACRRALINLAQRSREPYLPVGPGLWLAPWEDGYASARVLCASPPLADAVVALPDRDVLLVADPSRTESLEALAFALEGLDRPHPLTERLYRIRQLDDGTVLTPYVPPADHPAVQAFGDRLTTQSVQDYAAQRRWLEDLVGETTYVASARSLRLHGELTTYALWTRDVPALLPDVERVHLLETGPDGDRLWSTDLDRLRRLPGCLNRYPTRLSRWRTGRFPNAEELRRIATPLESDPALAFDRAS